MKCKICGEKLSPRNPPTGPVKIATLYGDMEYNLNEKRKSTGIEKVVTKCDNGHLQMVYYDWDRGEYVGRVEK